MKKELTKEELASISGGDTHDNYKETGFFLFGKGLHVEVRRFGLLGHQFTAGGKITARGYTIENNKYSPCYYVTCDKEDEKEYSGWYDEDYLQDSTYDSWKKIDESKTPITIID